MNKTYLDVKQIELDVSNDRKDDQNLIFMSEKCKS